jgi:hypothetical protein
MVIKIKMEKKWYEENLLSGKKEGSKMEEENYGDSGQRSPSEDSQG